MASLRRTTSTISATSWTRTTWAPKSTRGGDRGRRAHQPPVGRPVEHPADEALAGRTHEEGPVERRHLSRGGAAPPGCVPRPWRSRCRGPGEAAPATHRPPPPGRGPGRAPRPPRPSRRGRRAPGACRRTAPQVHEHRGTPALGHQARHGGIVTECAHVVHEVGPGVEGRAGAPPPSWCPRKRPAPRRRRPSITGATRRVLLVLGDGDRAGRVDSPPRAPIGPFLEEPQAVGHGRLGLGAPPAVQRVRGHVSAPSRACVHRAPRGLLGAGCGIGDAPSSRSPPPLFRS